MLAFLSPSTLPATRGRAGTRPLNAVSHPRRRSKTVLSMVADKPVEKAPGSLDELVRNWFRRKNGTQQSTTLDHGDAHPMTAVISGPWSGPDDVHFLLSTTIVVKKDAINKMAGLLKDLSEASLASSEETGVLQCAVNQSADDPACFLVLERFASQVAMTKHQQSPAYQKFIREAQPILEKPFGVHLCKERGGKITQGYYPFGPAGEGGRDDMIYR